MADNTRLLIPSALIRPIRSDAKIVCLCYCRTRAALNTTPNFTLFHAIAIVAFGSVVRVTSCAITRGLYTKTRREYDIKVCEIYFL
jgi:hypothetical protein